MKRPAVGECSEYHEQDDCADEGGKKSADGELAGIYGDARETSKPAAQEGAGDANDDVPQKAHAFTADHFARYEAGDRSDDDPYNYSQVLLNL